jgi:hypothetical protein
VRTLGDIHLYAQPIAADHAPWRMKHVHVAGPGFRIKRLLYRQWPRMLLPDQDGSARARFESEFELRLPARRLGLYFSHPLTEKDRERVEGAHEL